jgi:hypothetical protein
LAGTIIAGCVVAGVVKAAAIGRGVGEPAERQFDKAPPVMAVHIDHEVLAPASDPGLAMDALVDHRELFGQLHAW